MRYKAGQKEETKERIADAASRCFRSKGYAGIGVDGISKEAGVTSGAFYAHLKSKDAAFDGAVMKGLDEVIDELPKYLQDFGANWTSVFADYYLSEAHRADLPCGCAMTSLTGEVVRAGADTRTLYSDKMAEIIKLIASGLKGGTGAEREARAWAFLSTLIGGLSFARAVVDQNVSETIAESVKAAAVAAAGPAR